jgi:hypothetical protein
LASSGAVGAIAQAVDDAAEIAADDLAMLAE